MQFPRSRKYLIALSLAVALLCIAPARIFAQSTSGQAANSACPNDDSGLTLPAGFCATIFADDIGHARHMVVSSDGVLYINTWSGRYFGNTPPHEGGFLVALQDKSGSGKADVIQRFGETVQTGGAGGTGIGLYNGSLFAEINDRIVRYALPAGALLPSGSPDTIVSGLPLTGDHPMHPFIIDPKGSMFVDVASATNSCQEKNRTLRSPGISPCVELLTRGGIWRYDATKTNQTFSPAERYATGIRNGEGFAFDSAGRLFVTQHGRDQLHTNWPDLYKPDEEATLPAEEFVLLKDGGDYGWPFCYFDTFQDKLVLAPEYGGDGGKKIGECANKLAPAAAFPAHWAPNAMVHYDQKQFPARYRDGVFIAFHGSWNRAPYQQQGYNVVFQPLKGGRAAGSCEIFADGFAGATKTPAKADHRPSGLAVGPDGALYVSDDVHGRIYRIVYKGGVTGEPKYTACPSLTAGAGEIAATSARPPEGTHPDAGASAALPVPPGSTRAAVELGDRVYHGQVGGAACTGCHGDRGQGSPLGPDLTGKKWLWSDGSLEGITKTITEGVSQPKQFRSPMPPMGGAQLTPEQVKAVSSYVWAISHLASSNPSSSVAPAEITIAGDRIFPESLTSTSDGRVIIGSIGTRSIFSAKPGASTAEPWIAADGEAGLGVFGVFADEENGILWACFSSPRGSRDPSPTPSTLKAFDLQSGALKSHYMLPTPGAFCNDIAVGDDGTPYISDTANMEVDRLTPSRNHLEVWVGNGAFGQKGGVLDGISVLGNRLYVNTLATSKLFAVPIGSDGKPGVVSEVKMDRPMDRPDGMRKFGDSSMLVVEGGGAGRLSLIEVNGDSGHVTTLKEGYPDGVVSVAVVGDTAYVLEGQLKLLFGSDPQAQVKPFHATAVHLSRP
jgi:glucose/arabinose dehydrogenase/mono/diheme cytochrome c family protein